MASVMSEPDEIRTRMAEIRKELHENVQGVIAGTEAAFDWQYYVRLYPWASLAAAAVAGYLIAPRRRRPGPAPEPSLASSPLRSDDTEESTPRQSRQARKSGLFGMALGFLGPIAMRAAQNYASNYVQNFIMEQSIGGMAPEVAASPRTPPRPGPNPRGPYNA